MLVNVVMVGVQHPHMFARIEYLQTHTNLIGFYDDDIETSEKLVSRYPELQSFSSLTELFNHSNLDCCFIHALDHDTPRYTTQVLSVCPDIKGIFMEKPGSATPLDFFQLLQELTQYPNLIVEFGWELHYSEVMDFTRSVLSRDVLGDITMAHFHGGTPAGGSLEKWQCLDTTLGGFAYTDGSHTFEQVIDLFGLPQAVVASVRKLPPGQEEFNCVSIIEYLFEPEVINGHKTRVGALKWEDIGSVMLEYPDKNVVLDFTAWEAKTWCNDWTIDMYGTNGILHAFVDPPVANLFLREPREEFSKGDNAMKTVLPLNEPNLMGCFTNQVNAFLSRCNGTHNSTDQICGIDNQVQLMKLLEAIFVSVTERRFVKIK